MQVCFSDAFFFAWRHESKWAHNMCFWGKLRNLADLLWDSIKLLRKLSIKWFRTLFWIKKHEMKKFETTWISISNMFYVGIQITNMFDIWMVKVCLGCQSLLIANVIFILTNNFDQNHATCHLVFKWSDQSCDLTIQIPNVHFSDEFGNFGVR